MTNILILSLAVWRMSSLFSREDGPFHMFFRFRGWLGKQAGKEWFIQPLLVTIWEGIHCIWCNSVWFSAIISLVIATSLVEWMVYTLSISTLAILLETIITRLKGDKG